MYIIKKILFITIFLASAATAFGQNYYMSDRGTNAFYGGLIGGLNITQVDGDNYAGYNHPGMNVGAVVYSNLGESLTAGLEILYVQKGCVGRPKPSGVPGINLVKYRSQLNYAEVPIILYFKDPKGNHFGAGMSYAQLVNSEENIETSPVYDFKHEQHPFNKYDVNFILSGNIRIRKGLFLNGRFQYSVVPIRSSVPQGLGRAQQYNNVVAIRAVYIFGNF